MSIPNIIHLCWFGRGEYPALTQMCIESWKTYLPEYKIMLWTEDSFDVAQCPFTEAAYENKKWAFVSDYARLKALYQYGGVYMDTDLEVIKDFTHLLEAQHYVSSFVEGGLITAGFIACEAGHPYIAKLIEYYDTHYADPSNSMGLVVNPLIFTGVAAERYGFDTLGEEYLNEEMTIFPLEYFMPYRKNIFGNDIYNHKHYHITDNTFTIHHDMGSWHKRNPVKKVIAGTVRLLLPEKIYLHLKKRKNMKWLRSEI